MHGHTNFNQVDHFNCTIQGEEKLTRAVCFSPKKHSQLKTIQQTIKSYSPVKIENFGHSRNCEEFVHDETTPFEQQCVSIDEITDFAEKTISANVLGIHQVTRSLSCVSCNKKVVPNPDNDSVGECESKNCHLKQLTETCNIKWTLRILVEPSTEPSRILHLTLFNQQVTVLPSLIDASVDPSTASPDKIESVIFERWKEYHF